MKTKRSKKNKTSRSSDMVISGSRKWTHLPRLVIFDLDFTLWYPEMYELWGAPFKKNPTTGAVTDCKGEQVHFFNAVHTVMKILKTDSQFQGTTKVAVASRTTEPKWAKTCMRLMDVDIETNGCGPSRYDKDGKEDDENDHKVTQTSLQSIIDYEAIYPCNKRVHFEQLKKDSGIPFEDMLFFDNEYGNVQDIQKLGVICAYCPKGLTIGSWIQGMEAFQDSKGK
ncbi:unnamed protein product [Peronospora belbahrii]|uniref:Magnesium-dependent phosphatase-1 n=1 Tax=Peronospora belbahrii TaxID=622444 RepID=A0ABN8CRV2_9STRA|nr:unnamed protein product [Peronospora belbahrii]